jgi:glycosyltransferase involved in cell wall biosynthesis
LQAAVLRSSVKTTPSPPVSVVLAARDAEQSLARAVASILRQSLRELELIVVDDGSTDATAARLDELADPRLVVLRNERPLGLAGALNRGLERARGRYVARMDADDVALPQRLELQLARLQAEPRIALVGSGVSELWPGDRLGASHVLPAGTLVTRWRSLFGTPFFHPTVVVERELLDRHGLRYDSAYDAGDASTEDYELWSRLLDHADADNVPAPLLLYGRHPGQASARRHEHQTELRRRIALERMAAVAPGLAPEARELAWLVGDARPLPPGRAEEAADAFAALLEAFLQAYARDDQRRAVERLAVRALVRAAVAARRPGLVGRLPAAEELLRLPGERLARRAVARPLRRQAGRWLERLAQPAGAPGPIRVALVSPEPTPYRSPLLDRVARRPEVDLTVLYAGRTLIDRRWAVAPHHPHRVLGGFRIPGLRPLLRHDYRITPGIAAALGAARPDVVVVTGWSTFSSQAAIVWCRLRHVPFLLLVSSHDEGPRPGWRRRVKAAVVPRLVRRAQGALVLGSLSRQSLVARGADPGTIRIFANTVDVEEWGRRADELRGRRAELRAALGAAAADVVVLSVARLAPEKGLDRLLEAAAASRHQALLVVLAGSGPRAAALASLAGRLGVRLKLAGEVAWEKLVELYVAADVFALLSEHEPWGVVVNEAAACSLPLLLSDRVGAAADLLIEGENGRLVRAGDVEATADALRELADNPGLRARMGARSRELIAGWSYDASVDSFVEAVTEAALRPA